MNNLICWVSLYLPQPTQLPQDGSEVFLPIRIRRQDNKYQATQVVEHTDIIVAAFAVPKACYMDQKLVIRILCGSI